MKNHGLLFKRFRDLSNKLTQDMMSAAKTIEEMSKVSSEITKIYSDIKSYSLANCFDVLKNQLEQWGEHMKNEA